MIADASASMFSRQGARCFDSSPCFGAARSDMARGRAQYALSAHPLEAPNVAHGIDRPEHGERAAGDELAWHERDLDRRERRRVGRAEQMRLAPLVAQPHERSVLDA